MRLLRYVFFLGVLLCPAGLFGALPADLAWDFRTTGSNNNGGGFTDLDPGTSVDYSQQDTAEVTAGDLSMTTGGTTLVDNVNNPFTEAMAGNVIHITAGDHFVAGWYQITSYTSASEVEIDRDATDGTNGINGIGYVGGSLAVPTDAFLEQVPDGNTIYVKGSGTYTLTGSISLSNGGGTAAPITITGYTTNHSTTATGTDRPLFDGGTSYNIVLANFWHVENIRVVSEVSGVLKTGQYCWLDNCHVENDGSGAGLYLLGFTTAMHCSATAPSSTAIVLQNAGNVLQDSFAADSTTGVYPANTGNTICNTIIDSCTTGINCNIIGAVNVFNCTIYGCTTGIVGTTGYAHRFLDNIIAGCTTGASWSSNVASNVWRRNDFWNNGTDRTNVTAGSDDFAVDPQFADAANDDFRVGPNLRRSGFTLPGTSTPTYRQAGAAQRLDPRW